MSYFLILRNGRNNNNNNITTYALHAPPPPTVQEGEHYSKRSLRQIDVRAVPIGNDFFYSFISHVEPRNHMQVRNSI